jgi:cytochrome P450
MIFDVFLLSVFVGIYLIATTICRLFCSPIAHFPGPELTGVGFLPQFYYNIIKQGRYMFKFQEWHEKYGPVIGMNPYELHVIDLGFMDVIYTGHNHKRDKWSFYTQIFATPGASMNTNKHDHQIRRSALNPFFSKSSIRNLQPLIDAKVDQLLERFGELQTSGDILVLNHATAAFTNGMYGSKKELS